MWFVVPDAPVTRAFETDERRWLVLKVIKPERAGLLRRLLDSLGGKSRGL